MSEAFKPLTPEKIEEWREWIMWKLRDLHDDDRAEQESEASALCYMALASLACPAPCGHSSQFTFTEDGGAHMVCLLCERTRTEARDNTADEQAFSLIHDALHKGDVESAHEITHKALGVEPGGIDPNGPKFFRGFDVAFNVACRKHNVAAAYIIFQQDNPQEPRNVRVLTGGEQFACRLLELITAAGKHAIAEQALVSPPREKT